MIASTILISDHISPIVFDPGSSFSYVSMKFSMGWDIYFEYLDAPKYVCILNKVYVSVFDIWFVFYNVHNV